MAGRRSKLASISIEQLKAELARRQKGLPKMLKERAQLLKTLAALDSQIAAVSGEAVSKGQGGRKKAAAKKKGSKQPPREGSLRAALVKVLTGKKGVGVPEAVKAVLAAGYKSISKDFRLLVNQTLLNDPLFKKVSRGVFTVKDQPVVVEKPAKKTGKKSAKVKTGTKLTKKAVSAPKVKAARGGRAKPLAAFVQEALAAAPTGLAVRDIEKAVLAAGYVTKGKDLYNPIAAVMSKIGATKVSRGVYAAKGKPVAEASEKKSAKKKVGKRKAKKGAGESTEAVEAKA